MTTLQNVNTYCMVHEQQLAAVKLSTHHHYLLLTTCSVNSTHHSQCLNQLITTHQYHTIQTTVIWTPYLHVHQTKAIHDHDTSCNISHSLVKMRYSAKFTILLKFLQTANDLYRFSLKKSTASECIFNSLANDIHFIIQRHS